MCGTPSTVGAVFGGPLGYMMGKGIEGAEGAARATEEAARNQQAAAISTSQMSPAQLAILDKQTEATLGNLKQQQEMLDSVNPALMELGKQTLAMLKGDTSVGAAGIIGRQRADQKLALENKLRKQLGSGYASSSIGVQALNDFDRQSAEAGYGAATSAIPTLAGIYGQGLNNSMTSLSNINNAYQNSTNTRTNAVVGTGSGVVNSAGSQYAGDIMLGNIGQGLAQAAIGAATGSMTGGKKA